MSILDFIPTIPEIINYIECRFADHVWVLRKVEGCEERIRVCRVCGKLDV